MGGGWIAPGVSKVGGDGSKLAAAQERVGANKGVASGVGSGSGSGSGRGRQRQPQRH